ncbi:DNA-binding transcriptional ArsR family regulator [Streptacidiphilus sp. MAP12-33]
MSTVIDDELWSAVGDPIRRRMLDQLLADGRGTATSLSERLPVTRQAVAKHLGVLDRAGLVHATPEGRERVYAVDEAQFARAVAQLASVGAAWDARLRRIKTIAEAIQRTRDAVAHQNAPDSRGTHVDPDARENRAARAEPEN